MAQEMGMFRVDVEIENPARPGERRVMLSVLVDTGAELSWFPADILESLGIERRKSWRFRQADGSVLSRWSGPAFLSLLARRRPTTWCLASEATWSFSAHARWKGSTCALIRPRSD